MSQLIISSIIGIVVIIILTIVYIVVFGNQTRVKDTSDPTAANVQGKSCPQCLSGYSCANGTCVPRKIGAYIANWNYYRPGLGSFPPNKGASWSNPDIPPVVVPEYLSYLTYAFLLFDKNGILSWNSPPFNGEQGIISNSTPPDPSSNPAALAKQSPPDDAILKALKSNQELPPLNISIGGFNFSNPKHYGIPNVVYWRYLQDDSILATFIKQLGEFIDAYQIDGIDIDWEYPETEFDKNTLTKIVTAVKKANPDKSLTIALPANINLLSNYDFASLNNLLDGYNLMAYDIGGNFGSPAGSGIFGANTDVNYIVKTLEMLTTLVPQYKINVGMASYGRSTVISTDDNLNYKYDKDLPYGLKLKFIPDGSTSDQSCMSYQAPGILSGDYACYSGYSPSMKTDSTNTGCLAGPFSKTPGYLAYYEIEQLISNPPEGLKIKVLPDYTNTITEVLAVDMGINNNFFVVSYDSPKTIALKRQYIESKFPNIGGFFMWQLGDDNFMNGFNLTQSMITNSEVADTGKASYGTGYGNMFIKEDQNNYLCSQGVKNNGLDCPGSVVTPKTNDFSISQCCSGVDSTACYDPYSIGNHDCKTKMDAFCQDANLLTDQCVAYCSQNDCSGALQKFCQTGFQNLGDPNYNKTCSCYQNATFYSNWRANAINGLVSNGAKSVISKAITTVNPNCDFPDCAMDKNSIKNGNSKCTSTPIQICIQEANVNVDGNMQKSMIDNNKFLDCMKAQGVPVSNYPIPLPTILGISGLLIVVIIGFLVYSLKKIK